IPKPGTISGRAHEYVLVGAAGSTSIFDLRKQAYLLADMLPPRTRRAVWHRTRRLIIAEYVHCPSRGKCEGCKQPAPFMRRNGKPYLEVHHVRPLADGGADHPLNVAAVCPNCHRRVTHGKDAAKFNLVIARNVTAAE